MRNTHTQRQVPTRSYANPTLSSQAKHRSQSPTLLPSPALKQKAKPVILTTRLESKPLQHPVQGYVTPAEKKPALTKAIKVTAVSDKSADHSSPLSKLRDQIRQTMKAGQLKGIQRSKLDAQRLEQLQKAGIDHYNVVISGAGPAGLIAAVAQGEKNHTVCVYEARGEDTWDVRSSVLQIKPSTIENLIDILTKLEKKVGPDFVFSHKEKRGKRHPKSLEKIKQHLTRSKRLQLQKDYIQTDVLQRIYKQYINTFYPNQVHIQYNNKLEQFDPWLQTARLSKPGKPVAFDSIIHASGPNSDAHSRISEQLGVEAKSSNAVTTKSGRAQAAYLYHPNFKGTDYLSQNHKVSEDDKMQLRKSGWSENNFPGTYIFPSNPGSNKFWVCGLCPKNLTPEQQLEWNSLIFRLAMPSGRSKGMQDPSPIKPKDSTDRSNSKQKVSASVFDLKKRVIKKHGTELPFGKSTVIGDARETANFILGEGIANVEVHVNKLNLPQPYRNQV